MRKLVLSGGAALILVLSIASCQNNSATGPTGVAVPGRANRKIAFIFKSAGQYSEACRKGAVQANNEMLPRGITVDYLAPERADAAKQISMILQLVAEKASAIVISPNDAAAIGPVVQQAVDAGVKVYTWDSDAPTSKRTFYVAAADDVQIGSDIADAVAKDIGQKGKVQIMSGGRTADNLNLHVKGMQQAFKKYPGISLVQPYIYNDDDDAKARTMAVEAFQKDPDIVGFACANSPSVPAVGEAVTKLNKIGKVKVWGLSLPSLTRPYLKSGAVSGVMLWDPAKLTYVTARLVADDLDGKAPQDGVNMAGVGTLKVANGRVVMPGITFTKDNVDQYQF